MGTHHGVLHRNHTARRDVIPVCPSLTFVLLIRYSLDVQVIRCREVSGYIPAHIGAERCTYFRPTMSANLAFLEQGASQVALKDWCGRRLR